MYQDACNHNLLKFPHFNIIITFQANTFFPQTHKSMYNKSAHRLGSQLN
jgi:hypothetical protein